MRPYLLLLIAPFFLHSIRADNNIPKKDNQRWVQLFNGKNLDNWIPKIAGYKAGDNFGKTFRVEDGILSTRYNNYDSFNKRFGALYFDKKFTNFRLKVEYRFVGNIAPCGPSWGYKDGVIQYDCQPPNTIGPDQPFPVCLEYNLLGGNGKDERPTGEICASGMHVEIDGKKKYLLLHAAFTKKDFCRRAMDNCRDRCCERNDHSLGKWRKDFTI